MQTKVMENPKEWKTKSRTSKQQYKKKIATCRQRRVKCDETKPTCRNCDKSRRQCASYQPAALQRPQQGSQSTEVDPSFYQYQTPPAVFPSMHVQFPPSSPKQSLEGISPSFSPAQPQSPFATALSIPPNHADHEWSYRSEYSCVDDGARWSPGQGSWVSASMSSSQPLPYGMHAFIIPALRSTAYLPCPGRQSPWPPSLDTIHQQNDAMSQWASSISRQWDHSATRTNPGKLPSMGERLDLSKGNLSAAFTAKHFFIPPTEHHQ
ncbi:hypothetical protein H2198_008628 [Neophaeococcomyces mojaviensis]|uniref:Uncharacterized protein n=1 Tax=Neophaeococcomyces mojaviensis TaxID=3383035 RepID=A0ACC2ZWQ3_9EURO|nr:hypothetical protein H2198_008628 [Knufia sp. JES_112]